jgi:hypothetical protein
MFTITIMTLLITQISCQSLDQMVTPAKNFTVTGTEATSVVPEATDREFLPAVTSSSNDPGPIFGAMTNNLADYTNSLIPSYEKFELTFDLEGSFINPYNPEEIKVEAIFQAPSGKVLVQPGFYYQEYDLQTDGEAEILTPVGNPLWKVRFSPTESGTYQYYLTAAEGAAFTTTPINTFEVEESDDPGFIQISPANARYFEYQNGEPFFGIGLNVGWWQYPEKGISTYKYYFDRMGEYRANLARVWMTNSGMDQGWILSIQDQTLGADYNLQEAWMFDAMLALAHQNEVRLLLTLDDVNQYGHSWNWEVNLYNSANGGPCDTQSEIFTNPEAWKYQERIFRYIIARWGYSTNILSWELFNEIDELRWSDQDNFSSDDLAAWHAERAAYIKSIDAHQHLVNTSTGSFKTHPYLYEALRDIDFAQIHFYYVPGWPWYPSDPEGRDIAALTRDYADQVYWSVSNEPSLVGEFGLVGADWSNSPLLAEDDQGIHLHNALWSSLMSGSASTGLNWHWETHRQFDAAWWRHYAAIANFFKGLPNSQLSVMKPMNVNRLDLFRITSSASIEADLQAGTFPAELRTAFDENQVPLFESTQIRVLEANSHWEIDAYMSGNLVKTYSLEKAAGMIDVSVSYGDLVSTADFSSNNDKLRALGLRSGQNAYIWIQNIDHTWWNVINGKLPESQSGSLTIIGFTPSCTYNIEWWDPWEPDSGKQIKASSLVKANASGELSIELGDYQPAGIQSDVAVKLLVENCGESLLTWLPMIYSYE